MNGTLLLASLVLTAPQPAPRAAAPAAGRTLNKKLAAPATAPGVPAPQAKVLGLLRPAGTEWIGVYLRDKKAGWSSSLIEATTHEGKPAIRITAEAGLAATIGGKRTERTVRETRTYEGRDGGRLLSMLIEKRGDGGDETVRGLRKGDQFELEVEAPGKPAQKRTLPLPAETVELIDPARLAMATGQPVSGTSFDGETLESHRSVTTPAGEADLVAGGVTVHVKKAVTVDEKDGLAVTSFIDPATGRVLQLTFGDPPVMTGKPTTAEGARELEEVDLFGLTRVVLDGAPPESAFQVPGTLTFKVKGLKADQERPSTRQAFARQPDGSVHITLTPRLPKGTSTRLKEAPNKELAEWLAPGRQVESAAPAIVKQAQKIVGNEQDTWKATQALSTWVNRSMTKAYGASSDRATDVLTRLVGDCTEHALLFTSMARAVGIPARRVDGLVYMPAPGQPPALYWHEWAEVFVGGEWIAIDPTFGQTVADATHLALGLEGRAESAALIGQLSISVK